MSESSGKQTRRLVPLLARLTDALSPFAYPLIRVATGALLMPHGWQKLFDGRLQGTADFMASVGLEPAQALATYIALLELVGGAMLVLGLLTRLRASSGFRAASNIPSCSASSRSPSPSRAAAATRWTTGSAAKCRVEAANAALH